MKRLTFKDPEMQAASDAVFDQLFIAEQANPFGVSKIQEEADRACKFCEFALENFKPETNGYVVATAVAQIVYLRMYQLIEKFVMENNEPT